MALKPGSGRQAVLDRAGYPKAPSGGKPEAAAPAPAAPAPAAPHP